MDEHAEGRWQEVIALYCGLATTPAATAMVEGLAACPDSNSLATVLAEAYLSSGPELSQDSKFRTKVLRRIAVAPTTIYKSPLDRFPQQEVGAIANQALCTILASDVSEAHTWIRGPHMDQPSP